MNDSESEFLQILNLDDRGEGVFVAPPASSMRARLFGGQLLGQALAAASFTVEQWPCHSLHAYFIRAGIPGRPIEYEVSSFHSGKTFCTRQVVAVQRDEVTFQLVASFQANEESFERQLAMPDVPLPESFPDEETRRAAALERAAPEQRERLTRRLPVEMIAVDPPAGDGPHAVRRFWVRARGELPGDPNLHRCVLAYASDFGALQVCMQAVEAKFGDPNLEVASLDHAMWFHRDFRADEWLLFDQEAASVGGGRGLSRGSVFDRQGRLVASMAQEGVMRTLKGVQPG